MSSVRSGHCFVNFGMALPGTEPAVRAKDWIRGKRVSWLGGIMLYKEDTFQNGDRALLHTQEPGCNEPSANCILLLVTSSLLRCSGQILVSNLSVLLVIV